MLPWCGRAAHRSAAIVSRQRLGFRITETYPRILNPGSNLGLRDCFGSAQDGSILWVLPKLGNTCSYSTARANASEGSDNESNGFVPFRTLSVGSEIHTKLGARIKVASPIQATAIPILMAEDKPDVLLQAPTGSGKTLAYLLPALSAVNRKAATVQVLVVTPTRELAVQVTSVLMPLISGGSASYKQQPIRERRLVGKPDPEMITNLKKSVPHVAVSTLTCAARLIQQGHIATDGLKFVIVDEADHMLRPHQLPYLRALLEGIKQDKGARQEQVQLVFVTATLTSALRDLAHQYMRDSYRVAYPPSPADASNLSPANLSLPSSLRHCALHVSSVLSTSKGRASLIRKVCAAFKPKGAVLVHVGDRAELPALAAELEAHKFDVTCLASNADKKDKAALRRRLRGYGNASRIILSTDLAFRGLDLPGLSHVLLLDLPEDATSYVHCAGRVGRLGGLGTLPPALDADEEDDEELTRRSLTHARGTVITVVRPTPYTRSNIAPSDSPAPIGNDQENTRAARKPFSWEMSKSRPDNERLADITQELGIDFEHIELSEGKVLPRPGVNEDKKSTAPHPAPTSM